MHPRTMIRQALAVILTGLATTGQNVSTDPLYPLAQVELPALVIETGSENAIPATRISLRMLQRQLQISVIAGINTKLNAADQIDQIALEVEMAINNDPTLGGVCLDCLLTGITPHYKKSDNPLHLLQMDFVSTYTTEA